MKNRILLRQSKVVIVIVLLTSIGILGCQSPRAILPPVGDLATPDIQISDQPPQLQPFTWSEMEAIPISAHGKILRYVADVRAQWDIAKAAVRNYREFLQNLFHDKKK